jgi:hypothetical protein
LHDYRDDKLFRIVVMEKARRLGQRISTRSRTGEWEWRQSIAPRWLHALM